MPIILGTARPDCDYKNPKRTLIIAGQEGCPRQAQFKIWIQAPDGAYKEKAVHACRSHAPEIFRGFMKMAAEMRRMEKGVRAMVADLDVLSGKKEGKRVLVQKQEKGANVKKLNAFLQKQRQKKN